MGETNDLRQIQLAYNIRKIREIRNYTQEYVADKLSIKQNTYSLIETGKTKITEERIKEIAAVLEVEPDTILNFSDRVNFNNCTQSGLYNTNYINDLEKIDFLYKALMQVQEQRVEDLKIAIDAKDKYIALLLEDRASRTKEA